MINRRGDMSFPMPTSGPSSFDKNIHPSDAILMAINSNPYFIGIMMLLLNLGGRFIAMEMSKSQEQFFQNVWVRRFLIFTVLFMGTRNIAIAFWMTIIIVLFLGYLLNENSSLCIYSGSSKCKTPGSESVPMGTQQPILGPMSLPPLPLLSAQNMNGLNPEESQIYQTLHAKQAKATATESAGIKESKVKKETENSVAQTYLQNMFMLRSAEGFQNKLNVRF